LFSTPSAPGGTAPAVYDAYLDSLRNKVAENRRLLGPYFGSSTTAAVLVRIYVDSIGRVLKHEFIVSSHYPNLDYTIEKMLAQSVPLPPPPPDVLSNGTVRIILTIPLPTKLEEWREAYP